MNDRQAAVINLLASLASSTGNAATFCHSVREITRADDEASDHIDRLIGNAAHHLLEARDFLRIAVNSLKSCWAGIDPQSEVE
jgi:hypothetical protein